MIWACCCYHWLWLFLRLNAGSSTLPAIPDDLRAPLLRAFGYTQATHLMMARLSWLLLGVSLCCVLVSGLRVEQESLELLLLPMGRDALAEDFFFCVSSVFDSELIQVDTS